MRKECAISAGKVLVSFVLLQYILNNLIKTIYSSCNKTVVYLLTGKYAVDIEAIASVNNDF